MISSEVAELCLSLLDQVTITATEDNIAKVTRARTELRGVLAATSQEP